MRTLPLALGALVAGAAVGLAGAFVQGARVRVGDLALPWGLLLAVAATVALLVLARSLGGGSAWPARAAVVGWAATVVPLSLGRPEGDVVLTSRWSGLLYLLAGVVAAGVALALPPGPPRRREASRPS